MTRDEAVKLIMEARGYEFKSLIANALVKVWIHTETGNWNFPEQTERECLDLNILAEIRKQRDWQYCSALNLEKSEEVIVFISDRRIGRAPSSFQIGSGSAKSEGEAAMFATAEALKVK